ncbi:hypothetical protein HBB16_08175 [Pseudonocardia sp. MCCB 268]|nr:hypothetical protein [Pseudonocardia cytotoxica]
MTDVHRALASPPRRHREQPQAQLGEIPSTPVDLPDEGERPPLNAGTDDRLRAPVICRASAGDPLLCSAEEQPAHERPRNDQAGYPSPLDRVRSVVRIRCGFQVSAE